MAMEYNEELKRWVKKGEDLSKYTRKKEVAPPPSDKQIGGDGSEARGTSDRDGSQPPPLAPSAPPPGDRTASLPPVSPTSVPSSQPAAAAAGNRFSQRGRRRGYVDSFNTNKIISTGGFLPPVESVSCPPGMMPARFTQTLPTQEPTPQQQQPSDS